MAARVRRVATAVSIGCVLGLLPVWMVARTASGSWPNGWHDLDRVSRFLSDEIHLWQARGYATEDRSPPRILFVGDIMLDRKVAMRMAAAQDAGYPFRRLPAGWTDRYDLALANLEGPVTDARRAPEKTIDFQFDPNVIPALKAAGFDAFSQANNHAFDQGRIGFDDSRARLQAAGFIVFGEQVRDDEIALATTTVRGIKIAFLGFNTTDNPLDRESASRFLKEARMSADKVIVFMHWGTEYRDHPDAASIELAHWLIDHGADAVVGGHPHWAQGIGSYKGKPIAWSLGNFVFDQEFSRETQEGLAVALTLRDSGVTLDPIPIRIIESQPAPAEGDERLARLRRLAEISDPDVKPGILAGHVTRP